MIHVNKGRDIAAHMELSDTTLVTMKKMINTMKDDRQAPGKMAHKPPRDVATPFPPLNLRKTLHTCPAKTLTNARIIINSLL